MALRFHLDESVNNAIAVGLRRRGFDVTISKEAGLVGASDREQLAFALRESPVLMTRDDDFLRLHARRVPHAG
jgi:predicted nuclease of predicted toxin-antitoxin system